MDTFLPLRRYMERFVSLNVIEWQLIRSRLRLREYRAGEVILHQGDICREILFLADGLARIGILTEEGKDITWAFVYDKDDATTAHRFAVDYDSVLKQTPANLHIEAITDCRCIAFDNDTTHWLYRHSGKFHEFGRKMSEEAYRYVHRYLIEWQTLPVYERYLRFIEDYATVIERIPQYHIASYLGITPQYLSVLRKRYRSSN